MALRAVTLDIGDTLLREEPARHAIYAAAARARGLCVVDAQMRSAMLRAHRELPQRIDGSFRYDDAWFRAFIRCVFHGELGLEAARLPELEDELFATFEDPASFVLYPGARELLAALRARGLRVGAVSNWSARLPRLLERLELAPAFDFVLCSALEGVEKPDPRIFELALERAGCRAHELLHAGDHAEKDGAASALGIHTVLVRHAARVNPLPAANRLLAADSGGRAAAALASVDDLEQLAAYILALGA